MNIQFPVFLRPLMGKMLWRMSRTSKTIYLTFDDGPVPEVTPAILDILDYYGVKATFFCVGENVMKYPELYREVLNRGHQTGNHTFNHIKGFSTKNKAYCSNVDKANQWVNSSLFRPPHGQISWRQRKLLEKRYRIVMWDVITHDYNRKLSPDSVLKNVTRYARNGSIIVFHDSIKAEKNVLIALPKAIEYLQNKGYGFGLLT